MRSILLNHGFVFVWEVKSHNGSLDNDDLIQPHAANPQSPPVKMEAGQAYVFHPVQPLDFQKLGAHDLPDWIRESGCSVVSAPKSVNDMTFAYVGGPTFDIRFRCGRESYLIAARTDPWVGAFPGGKRSSSALILIWEK